MPDVKSCGILILRGDPVREFLLMRHPNRWDLPKGHVDPGETDIECALRETEEETGITARDFDLDPNFRFSLRYQVSRKRYGKLPVEKELIVFLGRLRPEAGNVSIVPTEHESFEWIPWQPPHRIQEQTIDPLLGEVERFLAQDNDGA